MEKTKSNLDDLFNRYEEVFGREAIYSVSTGVDIYVIHIADPALRFEYWTEASLEYLRAKLTNDRALSEFCPLLFDRELINGEDLGLKASLYQMRSVWERRTRSDFHTKIVLITDLTVPDVLSAIGPCLRTCGIDDLSVTDVSLSFKSGKSKLMRRVFSKSFKSINSCLIKN